MLKYLHILQLHDVSRMQQSRQREPYVKTLRSTLLDIACLVTELNTALEEMKILNISLIIKIVPTTCRVYSHTLVSLCQDWPQMHTSYTLFAKVLLIVCNYFSSLIELYITARCTLIGIRTCYIFPVSLKGHGDLRTIINTVQLFIKQDRKKTLLWTDLNWTALMSVVHRPQ